MEARTAITRRERDVADHDSSVGEGMYLTVCPLCGPGHDSSVGEKCILLSVLPVALVMIAQWGNESHCQSSPWPGS